MKISKRDALMWYNFFAQLDEDEPLMPRQQEIALAVLSQIELAQEKRISELRTQIPGLQTIGGRTYFVGDAEKFSKGCRSCLTGTGLSAIQRGRLSRSPLLPLFDAIVISEEVGVAKPDPKLIEVALEMLGCTDKTQAVMMGDSASADIGAAVNAGVDSIFFSPKGKTCDAATYNVTTHEDALRMLMEE